MKKNKKIILGIALLLALIILPALPFLLIKGQYNFHDFWKCLSQRFSVGQPLWTPLYQLLK
ncbi:hypothetical protein QK908_11830 [Lactococcus cremoris]